MINHQLLTLKNTQSVIETFEVVLTVEFVDEILWCDHSNEISLAVLSHGAIKISVLILTK